MPGRFVSGRLKYTSGQFRELGVRSVGRIGAILFVDTEGPLVLMHTSTMPDRQLDRFGLDRARTLIDYVHYRIDNVASILGVSPRNLIAQLARDGWVQASHQLDAPRKGANARVGRPKTARRRKRTPDQERT